MKAYMIIGPAIASLGACTVHAHRPPDNFAGNPDVFISSGQTPTAAPKSFPLDKSCALTLPSHTERQGGGTVTRWDVPPFQATSLQLATDLWAAPFCQQATLVLPSQRNALPNYPKYLIALTEALAKDDPTAPQGRLEIRFVADTMSAPQIGHSYKFQYAPISTTDTLPAENRSGLFVDWQPGRAILAQKSQATYAIDYKQSTIIFRQLPQGNGDELTVDMDIQVNEFPTGQGSPSRQHKIKGHLSASAYALWKKASP